MQIDQIINQAAAELPEGNRLILSIEKGGYGVELRHNVSATEHIDIEMSSDSLESSAADAIQVAKDVSRAYRFSHNDTEESASQVHARKSEEVEVSREEVIAAISPYGLAHLERTMGREATDYGKFITSGDNPRTCYVVTVANMDYIFVPA